MVSDELLKSGDEYANRSVSDSNYRSRRLVVDDFIEYLEEEDRADIESWDDIYQGVIERFEKYLLDEGGYADITVSNRISFIRGWAKMEDRGSLFVDYDYSRIPQTPKRKEREITYISKEEYKKLIDMENVHGVENKARNQMVIKAGWNLGCRASELCNIKLDDVEIDERRVWIDTLKGGRNHYAYFTHRFKSDLKDWLDIRDGMRHADQNYLFPSHRGGQISQTLANDIVKESAHNAGIQDHWVDAQEYKQHRVVFSTLRDSYASHRILNGMDIYKLQRALGHKNLETTAHYLSVKQQERKEANDKYSPSVVDDDLLLAHNL